MSLNWQRWFDDCVIHINNTVRPYLKQSVLLVNASRSIQVHFRTLSTDERELQIVIEYVSEALKAARNPDVRRKRNDAVDKIFAKADERIQKFCAKYRITLDGDMNLVIREDQKATSDLQVVSRIAEKRAKAAKSKRSTEIRMTFWPPDMQKFQDKKKLEDMRTHLFFKIENDVTLNHVLSRLLQKSMEGKQGLPSVHLIQNPGFFAAVPETLKDFREGDRGRLKTHKHESDATICQLDFQNQIGDINRAEFLHVLLDPPNLPESELINFEAENRKIIRQNYRNIWGLGEQGRYFAAARENSGCLVRLDPEKPLPLPVSRISRPRPPILDPPKAVSPKPDPSRIASRNPPKPNSDAPKPDPLKPEPQKSNPPKPIPPKSDPPKPDPPRADTQNPDPKPGPSRRGWLKWPNSQPQPQPEPHQDPEPTPNIYRSHNAMDSFSLSMFDDDEPRKKKKKFLFF